MQPDEAAADTEAMPVDEHRALPRAAATWNPLTGQVRYLFQKGGSKGSPRKNLAAWRTSQL